MSNRQARRQQSRQARRGASSSSRRARAPQPGGGGGGGSNFFSLPYLIGVVVLALGLGAVVVFLALGGGGDDEGDELTQNLEQAFTNLPLAMQDGLKIGSDAAPVKMVQYEDFQCPFCLRYSANQEPFLMDEFVKTGILQIEFRHLPILGSESVTAAIATSCAAQQNRMWEFANRLFTLQARAGQHRNERTNIGRFDESELLAVAEDLEMDTAAFSACQGSAAALDEVTQHRAEARAIGFSGTPSYLINGSPLQSSAPSSNEGWRTVIEGFLSADPTTVVPEPTATTQAGEGPQPDDGDADDGGGGDGDSAGDGN